MIATGCEDSIVRCWGSDGRLDTVERETELTRLTATARKIETLDA
jgi:hypothetical protein